MAPNGLSAARSLFEQNIQKNREAGCDKTIFGQKPSRKVTSRLFAQRRFYGTSNDSNHSVSSNASNTERLSLKTSFRRESGNSYDFNTQTKDQNSERQSYDRVDLKSTSAHKGGEAPKGLRSNSLHQSKQGEPSILQKHLNKYSLANQQNEARQGSISSLAEQLGKLNLPALRSRSGSDDSSYVSTNSQNPTMEAHRNRVNLPDFRQSSCRSRRPTPASVNHIQGKLEENDSLSSLNHSNQNHLDTSIQSYPGTGRCDEPDGSSQSNLDRSGKSYQSYQGLRRSNSRRGASSRTIVNRLESNASGHGAISNNSARDEKLMIRRSSSRDWSKRSGHASKSEPLTAVPFPTRTVIKRHNSNRSKQDSSYALTRRNTQGMKRSLSRPKIQPAYVDPEEQEWLDEIEKLRQEITAAETKLVQVQAGEKAELTRIEETKERKLRRVENEERQPEVSGSHKLNDEECQRIDEKYHEVQQELKDLKRENARIHDEIRKLKIQILTTASSGSLTEEDTTEMDGYVSDLEKEKKRQLREHNQLLKMISSYHNVIADLRETLELKDNRILRVKKIRFLYDDRIDGIVDLVKDKCADPDLVEELTTMAVDDAGWDGDWSAQPNERARLSVVTKTPSTLAGENTEEDKESPKSVADLISTSSHSLHIFRE